MAKIKGIAWGGTKVDKDKYEATAKFFTEVLGLKVVRSEKDVTVYVLPNGDVFEVIGPTQATELNEFVSGPKIDFLADDVNGMRKEMEKHGVKFEGPVQSSPDQSFTHFFAPDGHLYGLTDMHGHPSHKAE